RHGRVRHRRRIAGSDEKAQTHAAHPRQGRNQGDPMSLEIRTATSADVPLILSFVRDLAEYEKLSHLVTATEAGLRDSLFGSKPGAEVLLAFADGDAVGFAVFFHNFSTFLGVKGLWLEDLFVRPAFRGRGYGKELLLHVGRIAVERGCGRYEWA